MAVFACELSDGVNNLKIIFSTVCSIHTTHHWRVHCYPALILYLISDPRTNLNSLVDISTLLLEDSAKFYKLHNHNPNIRWPSSPPLSYYIMIRNNVLHKDMIWFSLTTVLLWKPEVPFSKNSFADTGSPVESSVHLVELHETPSHPHQQQHLTVLPTR